VGEGQDLKWLVQDELRKVPMKAPVKALMWDLLSRARAKDAVIPDDHTPSLTELEVSTSLGRSTLTTYLRALVATGWVVRTSPSTAESLGHGQRTLYRLAVGSFDLPPVIKHEKHKRKPRKDSASGSSGDDLVQELNQDGSGDDLAERAETGRDGSGAELVEPGTRSGGDLGVGQEMNQPRSGDDLNKEPLTEVLSSSAHQSSSPPSRGGADAQQPPLIGDEPNHTPSKPKRQRTKSEATTAPDDFPITAEMRAYAAEKCPDVKNLEFHTDQFLLHHASKGSKFKNWVMAWKKWMRNQQEWAPTGRSRTASGTDWRDVSNQNHSGWNQGGTTQ
jgi:hypothetical protein